MAVVDLLLELIIICAAVAIIGALLYGIHTMRRKIQLQNARLIWRAVCRHKNSRS